MDIELKFEQIPCYDLWTKAVTTHEETTETNLPDYCATASRILDATGQLLVREKQPAEGLLRGDVRITVLYLSEESEGLQSVTVLVPFTCELSEPKLRECQLLQVHSRLLLCEVKPITGRRLYLRVIPELTVFGYGRKVLRLCCGAEGQGLQVKQEKKQLSLLTVLEERFCSTAQEFDLNSIEAEEILLHRVFARVLSSQSIGSKLVVKGEMDVSALLRTPGRKLRGIVQTVPFSQILDGVNIPAESRVQVLAEPAEWDVRLVRNEHSCRMGLTVRILLQVFAYESREICYMNDLYSTSTALKVQRETMSVFQRSPQVCLCEYVQQQLQSGGESLFAYVTDFDCGSVISRCDGGQTQLSTAVRMRLLYQEENDAPVMTERSGELSTTVEGCPDLVWLQGGLPQLRGSADSVQARVPVNFWADTGLPAQLTSVCTVEESAEQFPEPKPSLVLCRRQTGESLWDIAKEYGSSQDAIRQCNDLKDDELPDGMLLIPILRT